MPDLGLLGMTSKSGRAFVCALAALAFAATGRAASSVDFDGSLWSLTYGGAPLSASATEETFRISLNVDADGYSGGLSFIDQAGFEAVRSADSFLGASLVSAPFGISSWELVIGITTGGGCIDNSNVALCANSIMLQSSGVPVPTAGPGIDYQWVFDLTVTPGGLETRPDEAQLRARFAGPGNARHLYVGAVTLVPEPETWALLLAGLGLMGFVARRRRATSTAIAPR